MPALITHQSFSEKATVSKNILGALVCLGECFRAECDTETHIGRQAGNLSNDHCGVTELEPEDKPITASKSNTYTDTHLQKELPSSSA